ncbi:Platinum sensitivity protein [Mortierella sp. AD032]|nr:Platinum sensitivity protein [Mortierella sp. AD032]
MGVHSTNNEDQVLDTIKKKSDDSTLGRTEDLAEFSSTLQELDGYSDVWSTLYDFPQSDYGTGPPRETDDSTSTSLLPHPSNKNLKEIGAILTSMSTDQERQLPSIVVAEGYIQMLVSVFETCENLNLVLSLYDLRAILFHLIQLGDLTVMDEIVKDETFVGCIGILEYEPDLLDEKPQHRTTYAHRANFKQVVPFNDSQVEMLIHQVFRLQFLKDVVLFRHTETGSQTLLKHALKHKTTRIVQRLFRDQKFMLDLFDVLEDDSQSMERRQDVVFFTHQFCIMAKQTRNAFEKLCAFGLFELLEYAFGSESGRVKAAGIEILLMMMDKNLSLTRFQIVHQKHSNDRSLFDAIANVFLVENDPGMVTQLVEVIRVLVDIDPNGGHMSVENLPRLGPDPVKFLDLFYSQSCITFLAPVLQLTRTSTALDQTTAARCAEVCKLMTFLVQKYPMRTKVILCSSRFVEKIIILMKNHQKHLRLMALKFLRACIGLGNDNINRILIKSNIIQGVVSLLLETNGKNNLLNSVCLEFFSFIRDQKNKILVEFCATFQRKALEGISYTPIFKELIALHVTDTTSENFTGKVTDQVASVATQLTPEITDGVGGDRPETESKFKRKRGDAESSDSEDISTHVQQRPRLDTTDSEDVDHDLVTHLEQSRTAPDSVADTAPEHVVNTDLRTLHLMLKASDNGMEVEPILDVRETDIPTKQRLKLDIPDSRDIVQSLAARHEQAQTASDDVANTASEHVVNTDLGVPHLMLEASDNGVEVESTLKCKRDQDEVLDIRETDAPVQQRIKLDAAVTREVVQSLVAHQE